MSVAVAWMVRPWAAARRTTARGISAEPVARSSRVADCRWLRRIVASTARPTIHDQPSQRFISRTHLVDEAQILAFARQFDPQPFHLDAEAAKQTFFQGLAASGWHTAAISMRLLVSKLVVPRRNTPERRQ